MTLINSLMKSDCYDHPTETIQLLETHISWVILTGSYVYKIKKPVDFGFLDFSTLEKRKFYCQEELRLNSRLAPSVYLELITIVGTEEQPQLSKAGDAIEFAVKMKQFEQAAQLDRMLERGELKPFHIDAFAERVADFHDQISVAGSNSAFGDPQHVFQPLEESIFQIRDQISDKSQLDLLSSLENWSRESFEHLKAVFQQRKDDGLVRECHGDMHLRNLAWVNNAPVIFDCIEFNPSFRWIDVISDVAFLVMDLLDRQQATLAYRFLNAYLEHTGDYQACRVLRFYLLYRAVVRAKVDALRCSQAGISNEEKGRAEADLVQYLQLAKQFTDLKKPMLMITRGLSASGKTTCSQQMLELLPAIRIRSDVERKRLYGLKLDQDGGAAINTGIYSAEARVKTYARLEELAEEILNAGYSVIVDATFLKAKERQRFQDLASQQQVSYVIVEFLAPSDVLRTRIVERSGDASDANLNVLEHQLANWQAVEDNEQKYLYQIDTNSSLDVTTVVEDIKNQ